MSFMQNAITLCFVGVITYIGNYIAYLATVTPKTPPFDPIGALLGMVVIIALALIGWFLSKTIKLKLESPTVIWISVISLLITSPMLGTRLCRSASALRNCTSLAAQFLRPPFCQHWR